MPLSCSYETVIAEMAGPHVLKVTLNRPQVGNALNTQMGRDLLDLWTGLTEDPEEVRCIVLTGAGEKIFCAGGDLKERNGMSKTATTIAGNAPLSVQQVKKSIRYGGQMELRTAYKFEVEAYNNLVDTEDRLEGVKAFNEKRNPVFKGR